MQGVFASPSRGANTREQTELTLHSLAEDTDHTGGDTPEHIHPGPSLQAPLIDWAHVTAVPDTVHSMGKGADLQIIVRTPLPHFKLDSNTFFIVPKHTQPPQTIHIRDTATQPHWLVPYVQKFDEWGVPFSLTKQTELMQAKNSLNQQVFKDAESAKTDLATALDLQDNARQAVIICERNIKRERVKQVPPPDAATQLAEKQILDLARSKFERSKATAAGQAENRRTADNIRLMYPPPITEEFKELLDDLVTTLEQYAIKSQQVRVCKPINSTAKRAKDLLMDKLATKKGLASHVWKRGSAAAEFKPFTLQDKNNRGTGASGRHVAGEMQFSNHIALTGAASSRIIRAHQTTHTATPPPCAVCWGMVSGGAYYVLHLGTPALKGSLGAVSGALGAAAGLTTLFVLGFLGGILLIVLDAVFLCWAIDKDSQTVSNPQIYEVMETVPLPNAGAVVQQPDGGLEYGDPRQSPSAPTYQAPPITRL